jgi:hypothetical protein
MLLNCRGIAPPRHNAGFVLKGKNGNRTKGLQLVLAVYPQGGCARIAGLSEFF